MNISRLPFGTLPGGESIDAFDITNDNGYSIRAMSYGATLISVKAPDKDGRAAEVTLGYDSLEDYVAGHPFFGSSVGRVCNRIGGASFSLNGTSHRLPANDNGNTLHGGPGGFHARVWEAEVFTKSNLSGVVFHRVSPDGEEGFPGTLDVTIVISLSANNEIEFEYRAETDQPTPVNLTNHAYWNLSGAPDLESTGSRKPSDPGGRIGGHRLTLPADGILEVDDESIPSGSVLPVAGTAFDFRSPHVIGERIRDVPGGYDHCHILSSEPDANGLRVAATVEEPATGRSMAVLTSMPAIQFYTGNKLAGTKSRSGAPHEMHDAFCLETQLYIDAVNRPDFPSVILDPEVTFEHRTVYRFMS